MTLVMRIKLVLISFFLFIGTSVVSGLLYVGISIILAYAINANAETHFRLNEKIFTPSYFIVLILGVIVQRAFHRRFLARRGISPSPLVVGSVIAILPAYVIYLIFSGVWCC